MQDERLELAIGKVLRWGVVSAAALALAGGVWYLAEGGRRIVHYGRFAARVRGPSALIHLPGPQALILAGLLVLIVTPLARVAFSLTAFAREGDRVYTLCTLIVLMVLLYSIGTALW